MAPQMTCYPPRLCHLHYPIILIRGEWSASRVSPTRKRRLFFPVDSLPAAMSLSSRSASSDNDDPWLQLRTAAHLSFFAVKREMHAPSQTPLNENGFYWLFLSEAALSINESHFALFFSLYLRILQKKSKQLVFFVRIGSVGADTPLLNYIMYM